MSEDRRADPEILVIDDEMDGDERAELLASLDRALDDSDAGRGMDAWEYLERRRLMEREAMNKVVDVRPLENYRVWLRFADGIEGEIDLSDLAGKGVFTAWADPELFKGVHLEEGGGIEWPGGLDICPDTLFMRLTGKSVEDVFPSLKPTPLDA